MSGMVRYFKGMIICCVTLEQALKLEMIGVMVLPPVSRSIVLYMSEHSDERMIDIHPDGYKP